MNTPTRERGPLGGRPIIATIALAVVMLMSRAPAGAQEPSATPDPSVPPRLEPPALLEAAVVELPEGLEPPPNDLPITLLVTIDPSGLAIEAEVVEPSWAAFDEVARDTALRSRFSPARRDGVTMQARIQFVVVVPARIEPPAVPAPIEVSTEPAEAVEPPERAPAEPVQLAPEEEAIDLVAVVESVAAVRERSAEAVDVVDLERVRQSPSELGDVLARSEGVSLRRSGGLGSSMRFSINGLGDDRIRIFLDGVPVELAGFPMSFGNMPVQLLDRVEIYRGVLPIRYGADALGGAVDLVTSEVGPRPSAALAYQVGSFGTHRISLAAQARTPRNGLFARGGAFFDSARNDFPVRVRVDDATGASTEVAAHRFHDAYLARGASLELGISDHRRIERLSIRGFGTEYEKDLQNNTIMSAPYGEVTYGEGSYGFTARAHIRIADELRFVGIAGYARRRTDFRDRAECIYDWYGSCGRARPEPGEIELGGFDQTVWQDGGFARLALEWNLRPEYSLQFTVAPTYFDRSGVDRTIASSIHDPLAALRRQVVIVSAVEGTASLFDERLQAIAFVKSYVYRARSEEVGAGNALSLLERDTSRFGAGTSLRFAIDPDAYLKASYEYATRLPSSDETFGNGILIRPNLRLAPELSHNLNLGGTLERPIGAFGALRIEASAFGRFSDQLILLLGTDRDYAYQNVYAARSLGVEAEGRYIAPNDYGYLSANITYQDYRNVASEGTFGAYRGARIPNQPSLFLNLEARLQLTDLLLDDELSLTVTTRFVDSYFRGWENLGSRDSKQTIPSQTVLSAIVAYAFRLEHVRGSAAFEARNIADARVFDFFGLQRPGRAFYLQLTLEV